MARSGPKPHTLAEKRARGTLQPCRDAQRRQLTVAGDLPVRPTYLSPAAVAVWEEVVPRAVAAGAVELDSAALARYCAAEAIVRIEMTAGRAIAASMLGALRQYEEAFRIVGARSRAGFKPAEPSDNVFARNGAKNRRASASSHQK